MPLYNVFSGQDPLASDVNQLIDLFTGKNDIGSITFAPIINSPTTAISGVTTTTGTSLGVGTYQYVYTLITGYIKSDGTMVVQGETLPSPAVSVTTTTGNTNVMLGTIPVGSGSSIIGRRIYRTKVGGSTFYLLTTLNNVSTNYTDSTTDTSLSSTTAPNSNTTGTNLSMITDTGQQSVTFTSGTGGIGYYRCVQIGTAKLVSIVIYNLSFQSSGVVATIPSAYAPTNETLVLSPASNVAGDNTKDCPFVLDNLGEIKAEPRSGWANTDTHSFNFNYIKN